MRPAAVLIALLALLGLAGAAQASPIHVAIAPVASPVAADAPVQLRVTFTNTSPNAVRLDPALVPAGRLQAPLFRVRRAGRPVRYTGMIAKVRTATAIRLAAGASITRVVDLTDGYAFTRSAAYGVRYVANGLRSNAITLAVAGREPPVLETARTTTFTGCSTDQRTAIVTALADTRAYADKAITYLNGASGVRYTTWFGTYDATRWNTVKTHYTNIRNAIDTQTISVACSDPNCGAGVYAFVYPSAPYGVYVCSEFWNAPEVGTDSRAGTLIHELSHFTVIGGTNDWVYGQSGAQALAISNAAQATSNADNHEYFAENNAPLQAAGFTQSATSIDFGSQDQGTSSSATTVTLTSNGDQSLSITGITATGDYSVGAGSCIGATIAPLASCTFTVTFTPTAAGARTGTIAIASNAYMAPTAPALTGTGAAPPASGGAGAPVDTPAPAATSSPAAAPASSTATAPAAPAPTARISGHRLTVTVDGTSFRVQVKRNGKWVAAGTFKAVDGTGTVTLRKRGTYRITTSSGSSAPVVVR